jgi:hypothetical protein
MSEVIGVACDGCGNLSVVAAEFGHHDDYISAIRNALGNAGWEVDLSGNRDRCPRCQGRAAHKAEIEALLAAVTADLPG